MTGQPEAEIEAAERMVWEALMRGDKAADLASLSADFLGVYPSGLADRTEHAMQCDDGPSVLAYEMADITPPPPPPYPFAEGVVLIRLRAHFTRPGATGPDEMFVTSIWRRGGGGVAKTAFRWIARRSPEILTNCESPSVTY